MINMQKGQITILLGTALAVGGLALSGVVGFFSGNIAIADKISADRERISHLEADSENLNEWLARVEGLLREALEPHNHQ